MAANGTAIRAIRKGLDLSLRGLSKKTGYSRGYLSRLETGKRDAKNKTIVVIADALGVKPRVICYDPFSESGDDQ